MDSKISRHCGQLSLSLLVFFSVLGGTLAVSTDSSAGKYNFSCDKLTYNDCVSKLSKQSGLRIDFPPALAQKIVNVHVDTDDFMYALNSIAGSAGVENYTIVSDKASSIVVINYLGINNALPTEISSDKTAADKSIAGKTGDDEDEPIFEGGPTPRQIKANSERNEVMPVDLDAPIGLGDIDGQPATLRKILEIQKQNGPVPDIVITPDMNLTKEQLAEKLKENKSMQSDLELVPELQGADNKLTVEQLKKNMEDAQREIERSKTIPPMEYIDQLKLNKQ